MTVIDMLLGDTESVMEIIHTWVSLLLVLILLIIGLLYTIRLKVFQIRLLKDSFVLTAIKDEVDEEEKEKEREKEIEREIEREKQTEHLTLKERVAAVKIARSERKNIGPFQAFCLSMGSRIGVGSLAGVAIALMTGGPGSIFWMWIFGFLGAAVSFVETVLGQIYKEKHPDGTYHGGMVYYIRNGLKSRKFAFVMVIVGILTAGFACAGVQANTAADILCSNFNLHPVIPALLITLLIGLVIFGGVKRAAVLSTVVVPLMALGFVVIGLLVILSNITAVPGAFALIFKDAFYMEAGFAGFLGYIVAIGVQRGIFMTNAGLGVTPSLTSGVKTKHPVEQGLIQARGVMFDMQVICTITALVILICGDYTSFGTTGIVLLKDALGASFLGAAAPAITLIFTLTFACTCIIGKYSFGEESTLYIKDKKSAVLIFRILFLAVIFVSCVANLDIVWGLTDIFITIMTTANVVVLTLLVKKVIEALDDYRRQKKEGIKRPVFTKACLSDASGVVAWSDGEGEIKIGSKRQGYDTMYCPEASAKSAGFWSEQKSGKKPEV